ncbi:hypothetical protein H6F62_03665 [Anabaena sp. FACHB-1391]|uniref:VMAP-C domain-containing protein n=1 Tax=Anabaena sp. FACHB-1391 TaxID=2692771 RepID=UPI0016810D2F|nr:hypothetical protein [Anabaena sp. FACHB-1391]MBD2267896.1 hypothetical protein [Anabaena sp. FACHB-1391]
MKLSDSAKQYLSEQIKSYYDDESRLKSIFTMNEETFGINFYGNIGGNDLNTKIDNLVVELIKTTKLKSFITIVRTNYPLFANKINIPQLELIEILNNDFEANKKIYIRTYQASKRKNLIEEKQPENMEDIIKNLNTFQDYYYNYMKFVVYLIETEDQQSLDENIRDQLTTWLNDNVKQDIRSKLSEERTTERIQQRELNPCILVKIISEDQGYVVCAWLIENNNLDDRNSGSVCHTPMINDYKADNNLTGVEGMVRKLIQQCITITNNEPQEIHIFLPLKLMNHPVDCWKMYEDERETIGEKYQIFIRCSEGLIGKNPRVIAWQKKGKLISENLSQRANEIFFMAVDTKVETLEKKLKMENARAAKIIPVFQNNLPGEILWKAAVPLALWVRQELSGIDNRTVLDELINDFDLKELPEKVRLKRLDAMDQNPEENHVGRHLCLLWDDPNLLPPQQNLTDTKL